MVSGFLRNFSTIINIPVIVFLIVLIFTTLVLVGALIGEYAVEHRYLKVELPKFLDKINDRAKDTEQIRECIRDSGLLKDQKHSLIELTMHPDMTPVMREALADRLIDEEQEKYDKRTKLPDYIAKLGPMVGLLGTLIPLGPGIMALGQGDTATLSASLLTAFDTTIAGLFAAGVAMVISGIQKGWYKKYMSIFEACVECMLEVVNKSHE